MKPLEQRLTDLKESLIAKKQNNIRLSNKDFKTINTDTELLKFAMNKYSVSEPNITELLYCILTDGIDSTCSCGSKKLFYRYSDGYHSTCGEKKCIDLSRRTNYENTVRSKYGVSHASKLKSTMQKHEQTMLVKYGVKHNWSGKLRQTSETTMIKRYGTKHALQNDELLKKQKTTTLKNHGTLNMFGLTKTLTTNLIRFGFENPSKSKEIIDKIRKSNSQKSTTTAIQKLAKHQITLIDYVPTKQLYSLKCDKCGNSFNSPGCSVNSKLRMNLDPCVFCNPTSNKNSSLLEQEIFDFIRDNYSSNFIQFNDRSVLPKLELDVYLPNLKKAIEVNGVYWHSEMEKSTNYHIEKNKVAIANGIDIKHVWEDSWNLRKPIVKSMILNWLNLCEVIYARTCTCSKIDGKTAFSFCEDNHLKGGKNSTVAYGLNKNDQLLAVMTFIKVKEKWILDRLCYRKGIKITGGASKMFKRFIDENRPSIVTTWADCDFTPDPNRSVYKKLGFQCTRWSPSYSWVISGVRMNRQKFIKSKLIKMGHSPKKTEIEIMHDEGFYRTFETGNWKFEWKPIISK